MERKGGCCIAPRSYGAAAGGQAGVSWQMGKIMLKFRPIAPKPAAMAPVPTPAPVAAAGVGKGKRKAVVGGGGDRRGRRPKKAAVVAPVAAAPATAAEIVGDKKQSEKEKSLSSRSRSSSSSGMTSVDSSPPPPTPPQQTATLPLMPVSPVEEKVAVDVSVAAASDETAPVAPPAPEHAAGEQLVAPRPAAAAAASWVTVEHVTATWLDGSDAPSASAAAAAACAGGEDDAPAFVSDQWSRVTWTNAAFARSVSGAGGDSDTASAVAALAGALPAWGTCAGFTCRVRVHRARGCGGGSVVAPCDAWRLDAGGCYLWRLDLQAALTLGLGGLP